MTDYTVHVVDCPEDADDQQIRYIAARVLKEISAEQGELTIAFFEDEYVRDLNREFRQKDKATDVLSFPLQDEIEDTEEHYIGDIAIAEQSARAQAIDFDHSFQTEILHLVIHGVLHLVGYDHEQDSGEMDSLELKLRDSLLGNKQ